MKTEISSYRFRIACRMLRKAGLLETRLPGQRASESLIDYLVRMGVAVSPRHAAVALIHAHGLAHVLEELEILLRENQW